MILAAEQQKVEEQRPDKALTQRTPPQIPQKIKTGFFDLPAELRNDIYELTALNDHRGRTSRNCIIAACSQIPAFANTCQQIRSEYLAFWIEGRTLEIHLNLPLREPEIEKKLHHWMLTVGKTIVPQCKLFLLGEVRVCLDPALFLESNPRDPNVMMIPEVFQVWHMRSVAEHDNGEIARRMAIEIVRVLQDRGQKPYLTAEDVEFVRAMYGERKVKNKRGKLVGWLRQR